MNDQILEKFPLKDYGFLYHYYRAEVYRETNWRNRLDITTNWSIVITAAMLTFTFGNSGISHVVVIINYIILWFFLYIEARRFRYYSLVKDRVKIFEKRILGPLMSLKNEKNETDWLEELSDKLTHPRLRMSRIESLSWRLRRNYVFILAVIFIVWVYKVSSYPTEARDLNGFLNNASVSFVPGILVFSAMLSTLLTGFWVAFYVVKKRGGDDLP